MKIISIKWRHGSSDFVHCIINDDDAQPAMRTLTKADTEGLFDFAVFAPDTYAEALAYVKHENGPKGVTK